jgi:hypothetical protein
MNGIARWMNGCTPGSIAIQVSAVIPASGVSRSGPQGCPGLVSLFHTDDQKVS